MGNQSSSALVLVAVIAISAGAFLYNKRLNLQAERQRLAAEEQLHQRSLKCAEDGRQFSVDYLGAC